MLLSTPQQIPKAYYSSPVTLFLSGLNVLTVVIMICNRQHQRRVINLFRLTYVTCDMKARRSSSHFLDPLPPLLHILVCN